MEKIVLNLRLFFVLNMNFVRYVFSGDCANFNMFYIKYCRPPHEQPPPFQFPFQLLLLLFNPRSSKSKMFVLVARLVPF